MCVYLVGVLGGCTWRVYFGVLWLLSLVYLVARFGILAGWVWCTGGTWCTRVWYTLVVEFDILRCRILSGWVWCPW